MKDTTNTKEPTEKSAKQGETLLLVEVDLRDYFAAKVLPAVFSDYCSAARETGFDYGWRIGLAIEAYEMADAMLDARSQK